jgi:hypothetical protein
MLVNGGSTNSLTADIIFVLPFFFCVNARVQIESRDVDHPRAKLQTHSFLLVLHKHSIVHMISFERVQTKTSINKERDTSIVLSFHLNATQSTKITDQKMNYHEKTIH